MRASAKGQVTIPKQVRERAGIRPGSEVQFDLDGDVVTLRRVVPRKRTGKGRGQKIVEALEGTATGIDIRLPTRSCRSCVAMTDTLVDTDVPLGLAKVVAANRDSLVMNLCGRRSS